MARVKGRRTMSEVRRESVVGEDGGIVMIMTSIGGGGSTKWHASARCLEDVRGDEFVMTATTNARLTLDVAQGWEGSVGCLDILDTSCYWTSIQLIAISVFVQQ